MIGRILTVGLALIFLAGQAGAQQLNSPPGAYLGPNFINVTTVGVVCDGVTDNAAAYARLAALQTGQPTTIYFPPTVGVTNHLSSGWAGSLAGSTLTLTAVGSSGGLYDGMPLTMAGLAPGAVVVALASGTANTVGATYAILTLSPTTISAETITSSSVTPCLSSTPLTIKSNTQLLAYNGTAVLSPIANSTASPMVISIANAQNVLVTGITIDGNISNVASLNNVAQVFESANVVFNGITEQNTNGIGIEFSGGTSGPGDQNTGVQNSTFVNVGDYVPLAPGTQNRQTIAWSQGEITNNLGNFAKNNTFNGSGLDEISIATQGNFQASGNFLYNSSGGACVYAVGSGDIQVIGNRCSGASGNGYDLLTDLSAQIVGNRATLDGGSGFSLVSISNAMEVSENYSTDNNQKVQPTPSGFTIGGTNGSITMLDNHATDDQTTPTQEFGLYGQSGMTFTTQNWVDQSNDFGTTNVGGPFGGIITGYTAQKLSATVTSIVQVGSPPNVGAYVPITGTSWFSLNSATEGTNAVDLQTVRANNGEIANGPNSALVGGANSTTGSGAQFSASVGCSGCDVTGAFSSAFAGAFGYDKGRSGYAMFPSATFFATMGDRQSSIATLGTITTSATPVRLNSTNNTGTMGACANSVLMVNNQIYSAHGWIMAFEPSTLDWAEWDYLSMAMLRGANAAATTLPVGTYENAAGVLTTPISTTMVPTFGTTAGKLWTLSISPDTTNGCLNASVTGAVTSTIHTEMHLEGMDGG